MAASFTYFLFTIGNPLKIVNMDAQCILFIFASSCYHRYMFSKLHGFVLSVYFTIYVYTLYIALFTTPCILLAFQFLPSVTFQIGILIC